MKKILSVITIISIFFWHPAACFAAVGDGQFAYYKLEDVNDATGGGKTLTNNNSVTFSAGKIDNAVNPTTSGGAKYLYRTNTDMAFTGTASITLNCWAKYTSDEGHLIVERRYSTGGDWINYLIYSAGSASKIKWYHTGTASTYNEWNTTATVNTLGANDGNWHMHTMVYTFGTSASFKYYLDGVQKAGSWITRGGDQHTSNNSESFSIGGNPNGDTMNGSVDECGVWNTIKTQAEITLLYNGGVGGIPWQYPYTATTTSVVASPLSSSSYWFNLLDN